MEVGWRVASQRIRNRVFPANTAPCWRHSDTLVSDPTPSIIRFVGGGWWVVNQSPGIPASAHAAAVTPPEHNPHPRALNDRFRLGRLANRRPLGLQASSHCRSLQGAAAPTRTPPSSTSCRSIPPVYHIGPR
eukprot:752440-Hanusia_phi.AAC.1